MKKVRRSKTFHQNNPRSRKRPRLRFERPSPVGSRREPACLRGLFFRSRKKRGFSTRFGPGRCLAVIRCGGPATRIPALVRAWAGVVRMCDADGVAATLVRVAGEGCTFSLVPVKGILPSRQDQSPPDEDDLGIFLPTMGIFIGN